MEKRNAVKLISAFLLVTLLFFSCESTSNKEYVSSGTKEAEQMSLNLEAAGVVTIPVEPHPAYSYFSSVKPEILALVEKGSDFNAVQLMTVHASKGLAFPVVISTFGLSEKNNMEGKAPYLFHHDSKTYLSFEKRFKLSADDNDTINNRVQKESNQEKAMVETIKNSSVSIISSAFWLIFPTLYASLNLAFKIFFVIGAVDAHFIGRTFIKTGKISAEHQKIGTHGKSQCHVVIMDYSAVGANRNIYAGLFKILVTSLCNIVILNGVEPPEPAAFLTVALVVVGINYSAYTAHHIVILVEGQPHSAFAI